MMVGTRLRRSDAVSAPLFQTLFFSGALYQMDARDESLGFWQGSVGLTDVLRFLIHVDVREERDSGSSRHVFSISSLARRDSAVRDVRSVRAEEFAGAAAQHMEFRECDVSHMTSHLTQEVTGD